MVFPDQDVGGRMRAPPRGMGRGDSRSPLVTLKKMKFRCQLVKVTQCGNMKRDQLQTSNDLN